MILRYPVNYICITTYFNDGSHQGIDLGWSEIYGMNQKIYAAADGIVSNNVTLRLLSHVFLNSSTLPTAIFADNDGKIAVAIPCANIPYGICHTLSTILNAVTLPALNNDENVLDINTFI